MKKISVLVAILIGLAFSTPAFAQSTAPAGGDGGTQVAQSALPRAESLAELLQKRVPKDIQIPADVSITPPDSGVPDAMKKFSAAWFCRWYGDQSGTYMGDQVFVFEAITPSSVKIASVGVGRFVSTGPANNYGQKWSRRAELKTRREGVAPIELEYGNVSSTYSMDGGGALKVRNVTPYGTWVTDGCQKIQ